MTILLDTMLSTFQESTSSSHHVEQSFISHLQKEIQKIYERIVRHFLSSMDTTLWKLNGSYPRKIILPAFGYICVVISLHRIRLKASNTTHALLPAFLSGYHSVPFLDLFQIVEWASTHGVRSAADRFLTGESSIRKYLADFRSSPFRDLQLSGLSVRELVRTCIQTVSLHFLQPARTFKSRDVISYWNQTPPVDPMPRGIQTLSCRRTLWLSTISWAHKEVIFMERKRLDDTRLSFLDAIGIPPARVEAYDLSYEKTGGLTTVIHRLTLTDLRPSCPNCGCLTPEIHSYTDKRIKHTSLSGKHSQLYLHHRRYICPQCRKTYYEHNPFVIRASQKISKDVVYSILDSLRDPSRTFTSVAEGYGVSVTTVMNIFDTHVRMTRSALGEYLSIDENHCFGRGADAYVCVLLDFRTQEPVDILPNRHKDELIRYFRSIPWEERNRVKAVCIDMYPIYRDAVRVTFPEDVKVCVDHFHLIKEFTQQADEVRLSVMRPIYRELQRLRREKRKLECLPDAGTAANREHIQTLDVEVQKHSRNYYLLKKFHWMIFKDPNDEIFDPGRGKKYNPSLERYMNFHEIREALCNISPVLCEVINVRGRLVELYKCPSGEEGSEKLYELIGDLRHSGIQEMRHFAGTLERWSLEILNSLDSIERYYEVQKDGGVLIRDRRIHNGIIERNFMAESATCHG